MENVFYDGSAKNKFINYYKMILTPSAELCRQDFTFSGYSYGEVFELAAGIKKMLASAAGKRHFACALRKSVTAACVLASLAGCLSVDSSLFLFRARADGNAKPPVLISRLPIIRKNCLPAWKLSPLLPVKYPN